MTKTEQIDEQKRLAAAVKRRLYRGVKGISTVIVSYHIRPRSKDVQFAFYFEAGTPPHVGDRIEFKDHQATVEEIL